MKITVFGIGEAGSLIAADLVMQGIDVAAYDPAEVKTPQGVKRVDNPGAAVEDADFVISVTAGPDAVQAIRQALDQIPPAAVYADFSTNTFSAKQELAAIAESREIEFTDIALMGTVPGRGIRTPALASGGGASKFVKKFTDLSMPVQMISDTPGDAASRKLLRSIMMKGLASCVIEAMRGAEKAGCSDWLWQNLADELTGADAEFLYRLVIGSKKHAVRRLHEMEASAAMLTDLGVTPLLTGATVENLRRMPEEGLPLIPATAD